jgi:hypothetical protein
MIRTLSLLLRSAHRKGFVLGGRQDALQLVESPFLMHPIEHKTAGAWGCSSTMAGTGRCAPCVPWPTAMVP